jgi:putative Holliday junction resolvase
MPDKVTQILAIDVGDKRIGVALANSAARIASPLTTISNDPTTASVLKRLINEHQASALVVGLPRNLNGQYTEQTRVVEAFVESLKNQQIGLPIHWQDEAVTSLKAEHELSQKRGEYKKGDVDALAATYILEDFLNEHQGITV